MSGSTLTAQRCVSGDPTNIVGLLSHAMVEFPEFSWGGGLASACTRMIEATEPLDRLELLAMDGGRLVGCMILVPDDDLHVGPSLTVMWNYVLPEYRGAIGRKFMRAAFREARYQGLAVIGYTHRLGVGQYKTTYRQVR